MSDNIQVNPKWTEKVSGRYVRLRYTPNGHHSKYCDQRTGKDYYPTEAVTGHCQLWKRPPPRGEIGESRFINGSSDSWTIYPDPIHRVPLGYTCGRPKPDLRQSGHMTTKGFPMGSLAEVILSWSPSTRVVALRQSLGLSPVRRGRSSSDSPRTGIGGR